MTRGRVFLITVLTLVALDAGRSIWARVGFAQPRTRWRPDPAQFASIAWPPGADAKPELPLGQRVFLRHCQTCHGPDGRGNGPAAPSMSPRPRNFTLGQFKYKSTRPESPPTEADLLRTVRDGLQASAMPYFGDLLSDEELRAVVAYVRSLGPRAEVAAPIPVPPRERANTASVERGKALYGQSCAPCHGADGRAQNRYDDQSGRQVAARDLTAPWTFHGGSEPEQIWLRLTTGMALSAMPSYADTLKPAERWDIVNYVLTLARVPPWTPGGKLAGPGQDADLVRRGDYLAHASMCGLCHTQIDPTGIYREEGYFLAGGMRVGAWPHPNFISRNLTSDLDTGLGSQSVEQVARTLRTGRRFDRVLDPWGMPWFFMYPLVEDDARAIAAYLKTMPPVSHFVPPPLEYGFAETLLGKLTTPLPAARPAALTYADGDFADAAVPSWSRDWPQRALKTAQWMVLALGLVGFGFAGPPIRRRISMLLLALGVVLLTLMAWLVVNLPQIIPAEQLAQAVTQSVPRPDTAKMPPHQAALVERGAYLFTTTSCAFCHGNDGSGGNKISWKNFGTLYTRNISSDHDAGIGAWSDAQVARAIRTGVSRHGRQLHWQGMTWDLLSNLDEEDVRALVAYLRMLPPVRKAVPSVRPPNSDDCDTYTFFFGGTSEPGCR
jgi:mono/diheme cytochrome c family protein